MALYEYKCPHEHITETFGSMQDEQPKTIECEVCKEIASRTYSSNIHIPEYMKATSEINGGDSFANIDNLKRTFKNPTRPSGKKKVYY